MSDDLNSQKADEILKKQNIGLGKNKNKFIELYEKLNKITHYDAFFLLNHFNLESEPQVKDFANKFVNSHEKSHSSYRNTAFGVAHSFNLEDSLKKKTAGWIIENGMAGYYQHITHNDGVFYITNILADLGIASFKVYGNSPNTAYNIGLSNETILNIAEKYNFSNRDLSLMAKKVIEWGLVRSFYWPGVIEKEIEFMDFGHGGIKEEKIIELAKHLSNESKVEIFLFQTKLNTIKKRLEEETGKEIYKDTLLAMPEYINL